VLNGVFVSGLRGSVGLSFHPQWACSIQYLHALACHFDAFGRCFLFSISFSNVSSFSFLLFILKNFARIFRELYFLNSYKFLVKVSSSLLNACYVTIILSLH